jgi:hypothetical protein
MAYDIMLSILGDAKELAAVSFKYSVVVLRKRSGYPDEKQHVAVRAVWRNARPGVRENEFILRRDITP